MVPQCPKQIDYPVWLSLMRIGIVKDTVGQKETKNLYTSINL